MRIRGIQVLGLAIVLGMGLASAIVLARPKQPAGCPRTAPEDGSRCARKNLQCTYRCEAEGHRDLSCGCGQDAKGEWRWECSSVGMTCKQ
jgi:hypothetical protein